MANYKKGSPEARAYMAKLRAAKNIKLSGTTKTIAKYVNIFGQKVKVGSKKYQIMMQQKKQFDDMNKYERSTTGNVTLKKSNFFKGDDRYIIMNDGMPHLDGQPFFKADAQRIATALRKVKKTLNNKVGIAKKPSSLHKDTKSHNVNIRVLSGTDKLTERLEYGEIYDTYLQLYLVKFANLSFSVWAVTGEGLTKALKHPEGKNQTPIVYRVKSFGIPKFEKMTIKELKDFK